MISSSSVITPDFQNASCRAQRVTACLLTIPFPALVPAARMAHTTCKEQRCTENPSLEWLQLSKCHRHCVVHACSAVQCRAMQASIMPGSPSHLPFQPRCPKPFTQFKGPASLIHAYVA